TYAARDSAIAEGLGYEAVVLRSPSEAELYSTLNNNDVAMVWYYGHGSYYSNAPLNQGNLPSWTNADQPVLYFSGGCNFNDNTILPTRSLGSALVIGENGSGVSIGASLDGGYGYDYWFVVGVLESSPSRDTVGEMFIDALNAAHDYAESNGTDVSYGSWMYFFTEKMTYKG
ncbi:MAG: C25 family cysteine peptidase, partial [bacterium]